MSICENTNFDGLTAPQKARRLHDITSRGGVSFMQVLATVNDKRSQKGVQPLSYKGTVNRLALLRRGKYVAFSLVTLDEILKAACQLVQVQINEPQP